MKNLAQQMLLREIFYCIWRKKILKSRKIGKMSEKYGKSRQNTAKRVDDVAGHQAV